MIFEEKYHPRNATKTEPHGAFNVHHFANGATLTVRRKYSSDLFSPGKLTYSPIHIADGEKSRVLDAYTHDKGVFLVRTENRTEFAPTYDGLLRNYGKIYAARARIESPVAWLNEPRRFGKGDGNSAIIVTKYRRNWSPLYKKVLQIRDSVGGETSTKQRREKLRNIFEKVFYELGKLHGAGVRHGHPHFNNILIDEKGNVAFTDPKLLGNINEPPKDIESSLGFKTELFPFQGKGGDFDLSWLTCQLEADNLHTELDWDKLVESYAAGVVLGKKRTAHLR